MELLKDNTEVDILKHVNEKAKYFDKNIYKHPDDNSVFRNVL